MNKNDRLIARGLIAVMVVAIALLLLLPSRKSQTPQLTSRDSLATAYNGAYHKMRQSYQQRSQQIVTLREPEYFNFDPNTADSSQLVRLGLQPWLAHNIIKYRTHGGIFRNKEDLADIYGITVKDYQRLEPYIHIGKDYQPAARWIKAPEPAQDSIYKSHKISEEDHIVLNTADTTELMKVPGIGAYYARKIAQYGQRLGGYVSTNQLDEIDDLPQNAKKYFVIENASPQKLNINRLSLQQLRRHPYINYYQAKAIINFRQQQGTIHSLQDLRFCKDFPEQAIKRLEPYVTF